MIDFNDTKPLGPAMFQYDLDEIVGRLRDSAGQWVPSHFPNGRLNGDEWRLANIRGDAPRKQGSCVITLKGEHAGDWIDFDGNDGGGPLSTLGHGTGLSGRALFQYAAELVGWTPISKPSRIAPTVSRTKPRGDRSEDIARELDFILSRSVPISGSPAETYLAVREIAAPHSPDLLFNPDVTYWDTKTGHPAMIAIVRDASGQRTAIHRTYIAPGGSTKADIPKPRMMLGPVAGSAVRLGETDEFGVVGVAEGIETGLSVMAACPDLPVWAALSAGNMEQVQLPAGASRVVLLADHDASGAGLRAARRAAERLRYEGRRVWIASPPQTGDDFNDLLRKEGAEAVRTVVEAAEEWTPEEEHITSTSEPDGGNYHPVGFTLPTDRLPRLRTDDGDLARVTNSAWSLLLAANIPPWLYRSGGFPNWVERDDEGRPVPKPLSVDRLRHVLAQLAIWERTSRTGDLAPAHPPIAMVKNILATPDPGLPVLAGIVTAPVFGKAGELLTEPGYHPSARLLYEPTAGFSLPPVPENPTPTEIAHARSLLLDDLLGEFPFTGEAERAHALALLLLPFVRSMIEGATPLHLIEKPTPGTGATLMVDAISVVTTGSNAAVMVEGRDDEEWRKRLTAKLRQIPTMLLIDNLRRRLDSSAVAAALTAPYWEDRVLGKTEMTRFPIRCTWIATGNNPQFSNEMARRIVRIRLDAHVDQPWRRKGFRHSNLLAWVHANRSRLVAACLTLGRAWIAVGMPRHEATIGGFEDWARVIGGILDVAGVSGFLGNLDEMLETSDGEGATWRGFVGQWWDRFGSANVGTGDLFEIAQNTEPPLPLGNGNERAQRTNLGRTLMRVRDRVFAVGDIHLCISDAGTIRRARQWCLKLTNNTPGLGSPGSPQESRGSGSLGSHAENATGLGSLGSPACEPGNLGSHQVHTEKLIQNQSVCEPGEPSEPKSIAITRADARTRVRETSDLGSPGSLGSHPPATSTACECEPTCEPGQTGSHVLKSPAWLEDVP